MNSGLKAPLPDYERGEAHAPFVASLGAGLGVLIVLGVITGFLVLGLSPPRTGGLPSTGPGLTDAADVERSWAAADRANQAHLGKYRWIDANHTVVQIPIQRAMELEAQKEAKP